MEIKRTSGFIVKINRFESTTGLEPHFSFLKKNLVDHQLIDLRVDVKRGLDLKAAISKTYARTNGTPRTTTRISSTSLLWVSINGRARLLSSSCQAFPNASLHSSRIQRSLIKPLGPRNSEDRSSLQLPSVLNTSLRIYPFDPGVRFAFELRQSKINIDNTKLEDQ